MLRFLPKPIVGPAMLALPVGLYGWAVVVATGAGFDGKIGPFNNALGCDGAIFYTAAHAWFTGNLGHVYDQVWLKDTLNATFKHWLTHPLPWPAFHYPPTWLLLLVPFGAIPFIAAYVSGQILTFAALVLALLKAYGWRQRFWLTSASLLLSPAASNNVLSGQNGFLVCALFVAGFAFLDAQPLLAGAILGIASFKPQICLMLPFALLGARNWRAIAGVALSSISLALLSLIVFGPDIWRQWLTLMLHPRSDVAITGVDWGQMWDLSVFTCAQVLGASKGLANLCQAVAALAAGLSVYVSFRRNLAADLRFAVFLAASVVAAPHVSPYDMIILALAVTIALWHGLHEQARPLALAVPMLAWMAPVVVTPRMSFFGLLPPLLVFALIERTMARRPVGVLAGIAADA
jgi:alpha-1,2-mannosyltransferase